MLYISCSFFFSCHMLWKYSAWLQVLVQIFHGCFSNAHFAPRSCCAAEDTCQSARVLCTVCPEGRHRRQERLVERCDVFRGRSPDIKLSPVNFVPVFKFAKRSVIIFVIFYWVHYTSFVSSVCIISIIFGLFTWGSDFLKKLGQQLRGECCGVCGHHQRALFHTKCWS